MNREYQQQLVKGIAVMVLIFTVAISLPIIGFFISLLIPLTILYYRAVLGHSGGLLLLVGTGLIMLFVLGGPTVDLLFFTELMLMGLVMAELIRRNFTVETVVLGASGAALASGFMGLLVYAGLSGSSLGEMISGYVLKNLTETVKLYEEVGIPQETLHRIAGSLDQIAEVMVLMLPAMAAGSALCVAWATLLMARPLFRSGRIEYPSFGRLNRWKPPEQLVWGVIGCGAALLIPDRTIKVWALNGLIVLMTIYFFGGIAIVSFFFEKKRFPLFVRGLLYGIIVLQQFILLAVVGLGFFDIWLDFRRRITRNGDET